MEERAAESALVVLGAARATANLLVTECCYSMAEVIKAAGGRAGTSSSGCFSSPGLDCTEAVRALCQIAVHTRTTPRSGTAVGASRAWLASARRVCVRALSNVAAGAGGVGLAVLLPPPAKAVVLAAVAAAESGKRWKSAGKRLQLVRLSMPSSLAMVAQAPKAGKGNAIDHDHSMISVSRRFSLLCWLVLAHAPSTGVLPMLQVARAGRRRGLWQWQLCQKQRQQRNSSVTPQLPQRC